jgi:peroxiredoxin
MVETVLVLARVITAFVLVFAAAAKLVQGASSFRDTVVDLGIPSRLARPVTVALIPVEVAIAALLLPGATAWWGALAAVGVLGAFTTVIAVNLAKGRRPACNCFGQISSEPIGTPTLVRNAALLSIALVPTLWSPTNAGPGVVAAAQSAVTETGDVGLWVTALATVVALQAIALLVLRGRQIDAVSVQDAGSTEGHAGLPVGDPAPDFALLDRTGETRRIADLLEPGVPLMLLFTSPTCAPCTALMPELATWRDAFDGALRIVLLSQGTKDELPPDVEVLIDEGGLVAQTYRYEGTPGAVLISPDGTITSQVASGRQRILDLLADLPAPPVSEPAEPPVIGDDAPSFVLPSTHGHPVSLADYGGRIVLLLFWDTSCGFCLRALPDLRQWEVEGQEAGVHLVVVTIGSDDAVRAQGWLSHVLLDPGRRVMNRYGAAGTPMAVLIDADGRIASDLATGADEVLELGDRALQLSHLASMVRP